MPATWCQAIVLTASACCLLARAAPAAADLLELEDALGGDDEVHLLQESILEKRRSRGVAGVTPAAEQKANAPSVCEDVPAEMREKASADRGAAVAAPAGAAPPPELAAPAPAGPAAAGAPPTTSAASSLLDAAAAHTELFRYFMDALTVLLVLDGCRRWRRRGLPREARADSSEAFRQLARAAAAGDEATARELISRGELVNEVDSWGCTALHAVAKGGMCGLATELLDLGAELDAADSWDDTPLHMAARAGRDKVCELLIERGAELDLANAQSWTPLVVAAQAEHGAVVRLLLDSGAGAGDLPDEELPPLLRELRRGPQEEPPATSTFATEDWEEHMRWTGATPTDEETPSTVASWPAEEDWARESPRESVGSGSGA